MASQPPFFPKLNPGNAIITNSDNDDRYNCVAWAVNDTTQKWWPIGPESELPYWPPSVPRKLTVDAFVAVFALLGYKICSDEELEPGVDKVAIYTDSPDNPDEPTHVTRQLPNGWWTSKRGEGDVIDHEIVDALEGPLYGSVTVFMSRPASVDGPRPSLNTSPVT